MAGLVPAIHVFHAVMSRKDVDARHKAGHDGGYARDPRTFSPRHCEPKAKQSRSPMHGAHGLLRRYAPRNDDRERRGNA
ncbi:hypothetical protein DY468_10665 [Rhodopseudomonas sp. BR0M22]|nr:hypothetical protein [Rhodopseudomonas sp. BR0M22]